MTGKHNKTFMNPKPWEQESSKEYQEWWSSMWRAAGTRKTSRWARWGIGYGGPRKHCGGNCQGLERFLKKRPDVTPPSPAHHKSSKLQRSLRQGVYKRVMDLGAYKRLILGIMLVQQHNARQAGAGPVSEQVRKELTRRRKEGSARPSPELRWHSPTIGDEELGSMASIVPCECPLSSSCSCSPWLSSRCPSSWPSPRSHPAVRRISTCCRRVSPWASPDFTLVWIWNRCAFSEYVWAIPGACLRRVYTLMEGTPNFNPLATSIPARLRCLFLVFPRTNPQSSFQWHILLYQHFAYNLWGKRAYCSLYKDFPNCYMYLLLTSGYAPFIPLKLYLDF